MRALLTSICLGAALLLSGQASAADLFTVRGIAVDVTADSAANARQQALRQGQEQAWEQLLARLTDADPRFLPLGEGGVDLERLVANVNVANERTSAVRYVADLTVGFEEGTVRELLIAQSIPFVQSVAAQTVLLPVQEVGEQPTLWEATNLWADAWRDVAGEMILQPIYVPVGDLTDKALLSAKAAALHDEKAVLALAARHQAPDAVVAVARGGFDDSLGVARVDIAVTRIGGSVDLPAFIETIYGEVEEAPAALYTRAARTIARQLNAAWKRENLIAVDDGGAFDLLVPVAGLEDWLGKRSALERVPMLTRRALVRLNREEITVDVAYVGGLDQVRRALAQSDLALEPVLEEELPPRRFADLQAPARETFRLVTLESN